jgi:hypothetical protein
LAPARGCDARRGAREGTECELDRLESGQRDSWHGMRGHGRRQTGTQVHTRTEGHSAAGRPRLMQACLSP